MRCSLCAQGVRVSAVTDAAEIVNQVLVLEDVFDRRATNVVMMGMGEPLMNLREVPARIGASTGCWHRRAIFYREHRWGSQRPF